MVGLHDRCLFHTWWCDSGHITYITNSFWTFSHVSEFPNYKNAPPSKRPCFLYFQSSSDFSFFARGAAQCSVSADTAVSWCAHTSHIVGHAMSRRIDSNMLCYKIFCCLMQKYFHDNMHKKTHLFFLGIVHLFCPHLWEAWVKQTLEELSEGWPDCVRERERGGLFSYTDF